MYAEEFNKEVREEVSKFLAKPCNALARHLLSKEKKEKYKIQSVDIVPEKVTIKFIDDTTLVFNIILNQG